MDREATRIILSVNKDMERIYKKLMADPRRKEEIGHMSLREYLDEKYPDPKTPEFEGIK